MWVTLYVDASFHHDTKCGGWAAWCRFDDGRLFFQGSDYYERSNEAELSAILNGMHSVLLELDGVTGFCVRSDCQTAVEAARYGGPTPNNPRLRELSDEIFELCRESKISRQVKWTKGHASNSTTPGYLNNRVDEMARNEMRAFRAQHYKRKNQK